MIYYPVFSILRDSGCQRVPATNALHVACKKFSRCHFEIFFSLFPDNRAYHFMQDSNEMPNPFSEKNTINMSSAEFAHRALWVNENVHDKTYTNTCVTIKDSDQPVHSPSIHEVFWFVFRF